MSCRRPSLQRTSLNSDTVRRHETIIDARQNIGRKRAMIAVPDWCYVPLMLVVGLPGSGKSTWCKAVAAQTGALYIDDFKSRAPDLVFVNALKLPQLTRTIADGQRCIVSDIDFTRTEARSEAHRFLARRFPELRPAWVYFENNPDQCRANVLADVSRKPENRLREINARWAAYRIPTGAFTRPVWASGAK